MNEENRKIEEEREKARGSERLRVGEREREGEKGKIMKDTEGMKGGDLGIGLFDCHDHGTLPCVCVCVCVCVCARVCLTVYVVSAGGCRLECD